MNLPIEFKPQVKGTYGSFLATGGIVLIATLWGLYDPSINPLILPIGGCIVLGGLYFVIKQTTYTITEDKIVKHSKIFGETHEEVPINKIQNTTAKSSYIQQKLGNYGTISVTTAGGSTSTVRLWAIKDYDKVNSLINQLSSKYEQPNNSQTDSQTTLFDEAQKLRTAVEKYEQTHTEQ